ncbi:relaxase domain-containing protein, partial [Rhodococcus hoagii]|nr:relaxase domain-containing protein [Prescottella equi]
AATRQALVEPSSATPPHLRGRDRVPAARRRAIRRLQRRPRRVGERPNRRRGARRDPHPGRPGTVRERVRSLPANEAELSGFIAKGSRQKTTAVAGYDLTFTPVKSVSTLWRSRPARCPNRSRTPTMPPCRRRSRSSRRTPPTPGWAPTASSRSTSTGCSAPRSPTAIRVPATRTSTPT